MNARYAAVHSRPVSESPKNTVAGTALRQVGAAGRWVCVIDPDPQSLEALRGLLGAIGAEVRTYAAAEPFLETLPGELPVCLISEVRLPGMSGLMLLRKLKSAHMSVPTILVTTKPEVPLAVEAIREGAIDFIEKPLVDARITRRVSALLSL